MKFNKKYLYFCFLLVFTYSAGFTKGHVIDSLRRAVTLQKDDTGKVNTLILLAYRLHFTKPDSTISLAREAATLAAKLGWKKGLAQANASEALGNYVKGDYTNALSIFSKALKMAEEIGDKYVQANILTNTGNVYKDQGDYPEALDYYLKALRLKEEIGNKLGQASTLGNLGVVYNEQGDYPKALEFYLKSLKIGEEVGNKSVQSSALCNIGNVYYEQSDYYKALDYYYKALKMSEEMGDKIGIVTDLINIGSVYKDRADLAQARHEIAGSDSLYKKALETNLKGMKITEELGDKNALSNVLGNLGGIYYEKANTAHSTHDFAGSDSLYKKSLDYYLQALKINQEIGNKKGHANNLSNIAALDIKTGKYKESEAYLKDAIALDSSIGELDDLRQGEILISELYDSTGQYKPALTWYQKAMALKDTLFSKDKNKALTRKEMTYEFEKKEAAEKAEQDIKDARQRIIVWSVLSGLLLVIVFAGFIFRSLRITRKQKNLIGKQKTEVEHQKQLVEEKNKDILDSINYAKRLQDAILPPLSIIKQYLPESFVLYKPKDIVAGDFYWLERAGDTILIAAADCTGHGVPGALVSVVCSNALNRTVKEFKITEPGRILDKVRELVVETFEKSENNVQDGMDISLAAISPKPGANSVEVQWSGANNALWYMQNSEMKEVIPDKQPIGKYYNAIAFNTHNLKLQKGDTLYLFTDGYADQFGGEKGKKFKYAQLSDKLKAISDKSMVEQKQELERVFEGWRGKLEQVDDVLVIGIRI
jgi:tetratricopeptide (TPR) repeat protein